MQPHEVHLCPAVSAESRGVVDSGFHRLEEGGVVCHEQWVAVHMVVVAREQTQREEQVIELGRFGAELIEDDTALPAARQLQAK